MRIAYVCADPGIPVFGTKGASVHVQEVIREFDARGHEVHLYTVRSGHDLPADLAGLPVTEVPVDASEPAGREHAQQEACRQLTAAVLRDGADLIYERYSLFSTVLAEAWARARMPGILEVNAPLIDEQRTHRVLVDEDTASRVLLAQVRAATATICVSEPVRDWVTARTRAARVHTIPNGVNVRRIQPRPADPGAPVVVFVGTLKPWHGVGDLLLAAAQAGRDWRLRIVGDGPLRAELENQAAELRLPVDFRGAVAPETIPEQLAGAAIGVAPYPELADHYFSPLKVYEYLAAGLPVVASEVGQIPEILDGAGRLVPASNPSALAAAIDELAGEPQTRAALGRRGRQLAEERYSWARVVDAILDHAGLAVAHD